MLLLLMGSQVWWNYSSVTEVKSLLDVPEEMWDPPWHVRNLDEVALLHAKHPITTHNGSNLSHFGMQRWSWSEIKYKNRSERKSAHSRLRCSPADNTHPTLKPWSRGDAWLRSGRLIPTCLNKAADNLNIKVQLACALHQRANWTREEVQKAKFGSHNLLTVFD